MRVLIVGNGGREAAIAREVLSSNKLDALYMCPPNDFFKNKIKFFETPLSQHEKLLEQIKSEKIDLVIVGPELPLVEGLSDFLRENNIKVFGASQKGAMLEGSKLFCKEFLVEANIPTADYVRCNSYEDLLNKSKNFKSPWIIKADGLAAGKGVYICKTQQELNVAAKELLVENKLGNQKAFIEENLPGKELSVLVLTNGKDYETLPVAQDHKRIFDGDKGPNTGGMGTVAPVEIKAELMSVIHKSVIEPFVKHLQACEIDYRGVIYFGIMVVEDKPYVLEINARFGDPEAQVILPLLNQDWLDVFFSVAERKLPKLSWKKEFSACVVLASPGYPDNPKKGLSIIGDLLKESPDSYFLGAGIKKEQNGFVTNGGRVLNAVGLGKSAKTSLAHANEKANSVKWDGVHKRTDIGLKVLKEDKFVF